MALISDGSGNAFPGWIAVIQPGETQGHHQVRVEASASPRKSNQRMSYGVFLCGHGKFSGYLLIGDRARLGNTSVSGQEENVDKPREANVVIGGRNSVLKSIQIVKFHFNHLPKCLAGTPDNRFAGRGFGIKGTVNRAVSTSKDFGLFSSKSQTWTMPYVGGLPGENPHQRGIFQLSGGIEGNFVIPPSLSCVAHVGQVPFNMTVTQARPTLDDPNRASWYQANPFQAIAHIRDTAEELRLSQLSAVSGISVGVFGSFTLSFVFQSLLRRTPDTQSHWHNRNGQASRVEAESTKNRNRPHRFCRCITTFAAVALNYFLARRKDW